MAGNARAVSGEQKADRARAIGRAARALLEDSDFSAVSVQRIADRAGVAKGTVFLYYATKESLGLAVLEEMLAEWWEDLAQRLSAFEGSATPSTVAAAVRRSLEGRTSLLRLLELMSGVLEANADPDSLAGFRRRLLEGARRLGSELERATNFLRAGEGVEAALTLHALLIGIHQLAEARLVAGPGSELTAFRVDVPGAVGRTLRMQLEGVRAVAALGAESAA